MGKGKPRHKPQKPQNNFKHCAYDDGTEGKECNYPWSFHCDGDMYKCRKLYFQHLATLSDEKRAEFTEKWGDEIGAPRTNYEDPLN